MYSYQLFINVLIYSGAALVLTGIILMALDHLEIAFFANLLGLCLAVEAARMTKPEVFTELASFLWLALVATTLVAVIATVWAFNRQVKQRTTALVTSND